MLWACYGQYQKTSGFTVSVQKSIEKALVLQHRSEKVLKNHWFYSIRPKKCQKTIGFTVSDRRSIKKPLVLQYPSTEVSQNHWFYRPGNQKR